MRAPLAPAPVSVAPSAPVRRPAPAHALLGLQRRAGNRAVGRLLQRYADIPVAAQSTDEWPAGADVRVSEDGTMAVREDGPEGSQALWATQERIDAANRALAATQSPISLRAGSGTLAGTAPMDASLPLATTSGLSWRRVLSVVEPVNAMNGTSGPSMLIWADCGRSAREILGVGRDGRAVKVTWVDAHGAPQDTDAYDADEAARYVLGGSTWKPTEFDTRRDAYRKLDAGNRERFDVTHGLGGAVVPDVGEAYVMDGEEPLPGRRYWNFHWATVVMRNAGELITLENYGTADPYEQNAGWNFQMYAAPGTPGLTFHDAHRADETHGALPITMEASRR